MKKRKSYDNKKFDYINHNNFSFITLIKMSEKEFFSSYNQQKSKKNNNNPVKSFEFFIRLLYFIEIINSINFYCK